MIPEYRRRIYTAAKLITKLYQSPDGASGGYGHVVFDDGNTSTIDVEFCLQQAFHGNYTIGDIYVSTVFLGLDHSFGSFGECKPVLFETMIFGGEHDQYQEGHKRALEMVKQQQP